MLLADLELPGMSGVRFIGWLQSRHPRVQAVAYTGHNNEEVFFGALRAGAVGFILKEGAIHELPGQLRSIRRGGAVLSPPVAASLVRAMVGSPQGIQVEPLSQREIDLLRLFADGLRYKEAAEVLAISPNTVHAHASRIYAKLNVAKRQEAIRVARLVGLI
jgi:DNA-binding NarL/FixJ family response regulator